MSDVSLYQLGPTLDISNKFRSLCFSVTVAIETDFEVGAHCVRVLGVCGCDVYRLYVCVSVACVVLWSCEASLTCSVHIVRWKREFALVT